MTLIKNYRLSFLTGILVGTSFIPFPPWAILFCYVPLWLDLRNETSTKMVFKKAWVSQFTLTLIGFYWIAYVANMFAKLPWPVAGLAAFLFCCFVHLYIPIAFSAAHFISQKLRLSHPEKFLFFSFALIVMERFWPSMFPWHLGYSLYGLNLNSAQLAEYFGFIGLSSFILLSNALIATAWTFKNQKRRFSLIATVLVLWGAFEFWGWQVKTNLTPPDSQIKVTLAQADIGNLEDAMRKYGRSYRERVLQDFISATEAEITKNKSDLLIWPESAMPFYLEDHHMHRPLQQSLMQKVSDWQTTLITGGYGENPDLMSPPGGPMTYNGLFILQNQKVVGKYYKTERLIFGEYLPLGDTLPILYRWIKEAGYFGKGFGPTALPVNLNNVNLHIGPQICYESLFADFSRDLSRKKNHMIVNLTNDFWYGPYSERYQHFYMTLSRSIENRTPVLRSTNTGISAVALASGEILERSPYGGIWAHTYEVPYVKDIKPTFYAKYGSYGVFFFAVLHLLAVLIFILFKYDIVDPNEQRTNEKRV